LLKLDKGNLNIWLMLGGICLKNNPPDIDEAIFAYRTALFLKPDDIQLEKQIASLQAYYGRFEN